MPTNQPTCFVISPIGDAGSETRAEADDFLELLVQPTLANFDYEVIRADRLATPTAITADIVRLVQESDLCIIDLTGHNANVFYECGRRHETGKPFIQMISSKWEERLPFDVAGIRTMSYDLSSPRAVLRSQNLLGDFIGAIKSGSASSGSLGASISTVALGLERLERKIDLLFDGFSRTGTAQRQGQDNQLELLMKTPRDAFMTCLRAGDLDSAFSQRERLKRTVSDREYRAAIGLLASTGYEPVTATLRAELDQVLSDASGESAGASLSGLMQGFRLLYTNSGRAREGLEIAAEDLAPKLRSVNSSAEVKALAFNQLGMLAWSSDDNKACLDYTGAAIQYDPLEPAYAFNMALAWKEEGNETELAGMLETLQRFASLQPQHVKFMLENGVSYSGKTESGDEDSY